MDTPQFSTDRPAIDRRPITIRTKGRNMLLRMSDGKMAHCPAGSEIEVELSTLDALAPSDFEIIGDFLPSKAITDHSAP